MRNNLYRFLTILCLFTLGISTLLAVPAYRGWQTITLSDGTEVTARLNGDEFYHFWETEDGKIAVEQEDGTFVITSNTAPSAKTVSQKRKDAARRAGAVIHRNYGDLQLSRVLVILVNFADKEMQNKHNNAHFNTILNGAFPSVKDYFSTCSNGQYDPQFDIFGPYTLPQNMEYYGANKNGKRGEDTYPGQMVLDACALAYADGCNFANYDVNNDNKVDNVYIVYAGYGEAAGAPANTIWPHSWVVQSGNYVSGTKTYNGKTIYHYACSAELSGKTGTNSDGVGTFAHEFSHVIGLPDYYDTDYGENDDNGLTPGQWTLMDQGSYNGSGQYPPLYSIYDKYFMGWTTPSLLAKNEKKNVTLTTTWNDGYQITGGTSRLACTNTSTIYYIENRQQSGYDQYLPGHGMIVWKVTYDATTWNDNELNNTAGTLRYTIVPADGKTSNYGASTDPFPRPSVKSYTPFTGCALTEITESAGKITFKYNGGQAKWSYALLGENCTYPSDGEVNFNASLSLTITPDAGYTLADAACWEVTMGSTTLTYGTDFTYNSSTNTFYIPSVTGDVEMYIYGGRPVTWMANGSEFTTNMSIGDKITLPATNPSDCSGTGGKQFVGWCTNSSYSHASTAPTFAKTGDAYSVATYYAVYATAGSGGGSSATYEFSITASDFSGSSYAPNNGEHTSTAVDVDDNTNTLSVSWTSFNVANNTGMQWKKSGSYIYNSTDLGKINSVTVSGDALSQYYGTSEEPTNSTLGSSDGYFKVTNSTSGALHTTSITVNFTKTTGGTSYSDYSTTCAACTLTGITLNTSGATTTFTQGQTFTSEGLVVTASYSDCSDRTVSPTSVSSPDMSVVGTGKTVTVSYTEGEVTKTATYTIDITAAPTYTIRFFDGTTQLKEESLVAGATATPPSDPADCTDNGYTFVGWYTSKLADDNTTVTSGWITDFTVSAAQDYYAVYSHTETSGSGGSSTVDFHFGYENDWGQSSSWSGSDKNSVTNTKDGVTVTHTRGTGSMYANSTATRFYKDNTLSFSVSTSSITSIVFTCSSYQTDITSNVGTCVATSSEFSWSGDASSVSFSRPSTASSYAQFSLATITIGGGSSTTYYVGTKDCTTPTEVTITFHKNDGTDATTSQTIDYNTATNLTANTFSREGYTFQGWATSASGEKVHNDQASVTLTKNTDLYAVWQKNSHNVSYSITPADKATATINSSATTPQSIDYGETVTLEIAPNDAYVVSEVTASGVTLTGTGNSRTFTMPDNDVTISITLAAKPKYTVTWSANGTTTTEEYIEGASIVFPATATADCDGKVFVGWSETEFSETDDAPTFVTSATMGTTVKTYYAVFATETSSAVPVPDSWTRITNINQLTDGATVMLVQYYNDYAINTTPGATYCVANAEITNTNTALRWTAVKAGSNWKFKTSANKYLSTDALTNQTTLSLDATYDEWTITVDDGGGTGSTYTYNNANCFRLNNGNDLEYYNAFKLYTWSLSYSASYPFYIYIQKTTGGTSYSGYTTTCTPCDYKVTLTKGEETNGTFTLSRADGTYNNCTSDFVVTVSGITPAEHYVCSGVTATGGNNTVTGPDGSGNYTVTYTKGNSITSTITANFTPEQKYTVTWSVDGDETNKVQYFEGEDITFPSTADGCGDKVFVGWSSAAVDLTDETPTTFVSSGTMGTSNITYYAVFATEGESGSGTAYKLVSSLTAGNDYIFVTKNTTGEGFALSATFSSNENTGTVVSISESGSDKIVGGTPGNAIIWSATASGSNFKLQNKSTSTYLKINGSTFALNASSSTLYWSPDYGLYGKSGSGTTSYYVQCSDGTFTAITHTSGSSTNRVWAYEKTGSGTSYTGYTTSCGANISAKNVGWITTTKGQKVKRVINVSASGFEVATTLSAVSSNTHFAVSLAATAVPGDKSSLATTLTVEYNPAEYNVTEPDVTITLTAGSITKTITVSGRSVPDDFLLITKKSGKWYALPSNMTSGPGEYDGVEVSPNDATTPTAVAVSPSTLLYYLASVATSRYAENGNLVRLVGNNNKCLWTNKASTTGKENIQNNATLGDSNGDNYEWDLRTNDGIHYYVENPHHPHYTEGRRLAYGTKFGMYKENTEFFIVRAGCSSQPGDVNVSPRRVDATFSWISNTTTMHIDLYTNSEMTTGHLTATASSSPYVFYGLEETTDYWYKLTPGDDTDCAVTGTFKTSGPIIDIVEWQENGVVLFIDKGDINPVIVIDGQEEHGSITGGGNATELFFAKYFEGAGNMKLLSIFNGTKNDIPLTNYSIYVRMRGQTDNWAPSNDVTLNLSSLGKITAGQEIIFFTRETSVDSDLPDCSDDFLDDKVNNHSTATSNPRWVECDGGTFKRIGFNGNDPIMLYKNSTMIDIIGSQGAAATTKNCFTSENREKGWPGTVRNMDNGKSPSDPAFNAFYEASSNHPVSRQDSIDLLGLFGINLTDEEIPLTTARCIFFRDKRVTSGDSAVLMNETTGTTFVTFTNHDGFKSEWYGRSVCMTTTQQTAAGVTSDAKPTCNSYQDIANMDYNDYYIDWTNIDPGQTLDKFTHDDETKEYTIPIDNMRQYACLNLRFQLQKNDATHEVLTEASQQVPIIVSGNKTTKDALFSELVVDKETHLPSYSHSVERCKTCNVVVLADATLTKAADDDGSDVPQVSNVKVYPTGKLYVPSGTNYTVNSLSLRRQEDDVASAKIEGTLNVLTDDATYLDIRIDPTNWHYFTLPYDCNVSDIRFANEGETAVPQIGVDFLLCSYDGEHRAATKSTSWKDLTSTDVLKKGIGYIIAIPGDGKVQREFRFPMANTVLTEENDDKLIGDLHAWGGNDAELRPNHKGWNLIGNPYMMYYNLPTTTTPLAAGTLIHDPDEDPWMGHWVIEEGTGEDAGTGALYYIVVPQDNGWSEYLQTTIGGFDMPPFTSYFVQLGGNPDDNKGIEFVTTNKEDGPSPVIRRAPAEDVVDNHEVWFGVNLVNSDGESDETTLLMSDKFTNDYDMMRDLVKMRGTYYTYYTKPVLASRNNEGEMAFNALPDSTAAAGVPLNFYAATAGQYRFTVSAHYPLDEVKEAYLYDNDNTDAKWHNLLQEDYVFDAKRGDNTTRFLLAVKVERKQPEITTSMDNLHKGLVLTTVNRTLMLSGLTNDADIYVYDVSGKLLDARLHYSSTSGIFRTTVNTAGLYFVRVKTPDGQQTLETVVY